MAFDLDRHQDKELTMDLGLRGKVVAITGASDGIGKAAAMIFGAEGAKVAICARKIDGVNKVVDAIKKAGGDAFGMSADMSVSAGAENFIDGVVRHYGRIDVLVNNAGSSIRGPFLESTDQQFKEDMELKVFGAMRCARRAIPHMQKQGGGRIINITTIGAKQPGASSMPTTMSRAAGMVLTKSLSKEFAGDNILVNTVCIGLIKSGQHERRAVAAGTPFEVHYDAMGKSLPLRRVGEASEAGSVIVFLASNMASYVTGTSINVDGGVSNVL
jgi:NAD(P)-dependent dehydrogenase (short-subunit alcohol dehydrogenase family)